MDYEERYKYLIADLIALLDKHIEDWARGEYGAHEADEMIRAIKKVKY